MRRHSKGFSPVEPLIVVTIILILAALSIPNLLKSRTAPNQAPVVHSTGQNYRASPNSIRQNTIQTASNTDSSIRG